MSFAYLSDLHLEIGTEEQARQRIAAIATQGKGQTLLLAGDITSFHCDEGRQRFQQLLEACRESYQRFVMVMGNHEHYDGDIFQTKKKIPGEVTVLDRDILEDQGKKIAGCTLWTYVPPGCYNEALYTLNDFQQILFQRYDFRPSHSNMLFEKDRDWLGSVIDDVDVVMTHHPPLRNAGCSAEKYLGKSNNYLFENSLPELVARAKVWICGHTHHIADFYYQDTRILLNGLGYPGEHEDLVVKEFTL